MSARVELQWGTRSMLSVDGVSIHAESSVPQAPRPTRPHVVFLHGFGSGTFSWAGVAPLLADRWSMLAWDRPPFGRSERLRPDRGQADPYRATAVLARSRAVLARQFPTDHIAGSGVVLVGHSAGAVVAAQLAIAAQAEHHAGRDHHPAIRGLVLIAPAFEGAPPEIVRRLAALPGVGIVGGAVLRLAILGAEPALAAMGNHRTPLIEATGKETARLLRRRGTAEALFHLTKTWEPPTVSEHLASLRVPTLVIGGAEDRVVSPAMHTTAARSTGGDLHLLDGVGHAAHEQVPDVVAGLLADFLDEVGARR